MWLIRLLLWLLRPLMLVGTIVLYPALLLIATFGAYSVEWGPAELSLVRVRSKMLGVLLILDVLGGHLRRTGVLLEERVKARAAFVLFDRGGELLLGPVSLVVLLLLLLLLRRRVQTRRVLLLVFLGPALFASCRLASSNCVLPRLLGRVVVLVASCQPSSDTAESRLFGLLLRVHWSQRLLWAGAIETWCGVRRTGLLLEALQLVVRAEAVAVTRAGSSLGVLLLLLLRSILLLLLLGNAEWRLRQRGLLAELRPLLRAGILELVVHCASASCQPHNLARLLDLEPRTYQKAQAKVVQRECRQMCATCST